MKIDRHRNETGGWDYSDPTVQNAVSKLYLMHRINLAKIDDWIEVEAWDDKDLNRVLEWRHKLIRAVIKGNDDAAEGWGMFLLTLVDHNLREQFLHPFALSGKKFGEQQAARRKDKPASSDKADPHRNEDIRRFYARLHADHNSDATTQTATRFSLSTRQIRRILRG